jgi:hypothetical protein
MVIKLVTVQDPKYTKNAEEAIRHFGKGLKADFM